MTSSADDSSVAEVAELLKLNQQTVRNWIDSGYLPAVRVGRRVRIKRRDFDRLVEDSYTGGPAAGRERALDSAQHFWEGGEHPVAQAPSEPRKEVGE